MFFQEMLTTDELAKFLKFPKLIYILAIEIQHLSIKQTLEAANVLGAEPEALFNRIKVQFES